MQIPISRAARPPSYAPSARSIHIYELELAIKIPRFDFTSR